jgi:hypothetical protein
MRILLVLLVIFAVLATNCERDKTALAPSLPDKNNIKLTYSREDSLEAEEFAIWFSGKLVAPPDVVDQLLFSLNYLRFAYSDSIAIYPDIKEVLGVRFMAPWPFGKLLVKFDGATTELVKNNQYAGWNNLAPALRPDTILNYLNTFEVFSYGFNEKYNPIRLAEIYKALPGVLFAEPDGIFFLDGTFPMFPGILDGELSYLFPQMAKYAPAGGFLYFRYINGKPLYLGQWNGHASSRPGWWEEAQKNIDDFSSWRGYP